MSADYDVEIVKIESTFLGFEDHGVFTAYLNVTNGTWRQSLGGYNLTRDASAFIKGVLQACGVAAWDEVKGRTVFLLTDAAGQAAGIETLPTEPGRRFLFDSYADAG